MPIRPLLALAVAAAGLTACQSDDELKADYRAEKNRECVESLRQSPNSALLDAGRFCGCVLDRQMAGKSASELKTFVPTDRQKQEWGIGCADASLRPDAVRPPPPPAQPPAKGGREAAREAPPEGS